MGDETASTRPVSKTSRLSVNGSTSLVVTPPLPCGLAECVAELHVTSKHGDTQRVHLSARQRRELVVALGGVAPISLPATEAAPCSCKPHPVFGHEDDCRYVGGGR